MWIENAENFQSALKAPLHMLCHSQWIWAILSILQSVRRLSAVISRERIRTPWRSHLHCISPASAVGISALTVG